MVLIRSTLSLVFCGLLFAACGEKKNTSQASVAPGDAVHGREVYVNTCSQCHGEGGKGDGPAAATMNPKPADHTRKEVLARYSDVELFNIIKRGGAIVGKPSMPPSPQLSDKDINDVIAHLRKLSATKDS